MKKRGGKTERKKKKKRELLCKETKNKSALKLGYIYMAEGEQRVEGRQ